MKRGILVLLFGFCIGAVLGIGWYLWRQQTGASRANDPYTLQVGCVPGAAGFVGLTWPAPLGVLGARLERSDNGENFHVISTTISGVYTKDPDIRENDQYQYRIVLDGKTVSNVATITIDRDHCQGDVKP